MISDTPKSFQPGKKDINYLSRDYPQLRASLINLAKTYYPNTYSDFSEASPGMMFIDMAAYVGDVLSYYTDYQFKESVFVNSEERKNIIAMAKSRGYGTQASFPSITTLDVYQLVPSLQNNDGTFSPDMGYAQIIKEGMTCTSDTGINFVTNAAVDFTVDTIHNPLEISVFQRNGSGQPEFYVLKKNVQASSGQIVSKDFIITNPSQFLQLQLEDTNIVEVVDVVDSDGNMWYETEYMAQDLVAIESENIFKNDTSFYQYRDTVPYILKFLRTSRRFTTSVNADNTVTLEFGAGTDSRDDELIVPNSQVLSQAGIFKNINVSYDPANFLNSKSYGQAPSNTTLTVRYIVGGGPQSNVTANSITNISSVDFFGDITELPQIGQNITNMIRSSLKVNNPVAATGGKGSESNEEIKMNAMAFNNAQNRAVTRQDYVIRTYSMPSKFGSIAKAYVSTDSELDSASPVIPGASSAVVDKNNPFAINLYILSQDSNGRLIPSNPALQENLISYLDQFKLLTDSVNIIDGFIINVGLQFSIVVYKNFNKRDVLSNCLGVANAYLSTDNMQFSQPINLSRLQLEIAKVDGVQSVTSLVLTNLTSRDGDYSPNQYNIANATVNNIVYPSIDPCVFEVRFPTKDIVGRVL